MKILVRFFPLIFIIFNFAASNSLVAQPSNYWSMGSNTPSSLLAGAVVGGGAGITSIFYNPAGISDIEQNNLALNASLFSFNWHLYDNALGNKSQLDYLEWQVKPRFLSYQFKSKKHKRINYQLAIFNRNQKLIELYDQKTFELTTEVGNNKLNYTASYDLEKRYTDYWLGFGISYDITEHFSIGVSLFGSGKTFHYYQYIGVLVDPLNDSLTRSSEWESLERQYYYVISLITKLGLRYRFDNLSIGLNVSLPSMRLWGDGYNKRNLQYSNIIYKGVLQKDYLKNEYNNYIVANVKEPLSISAGLMYSSPNKKSTYYLSVEYFAKIATYKILDNSKIAWGKEDEYPPGDDFLSYKYGAKDLFNVGLGYKHRIKESLAYFLGFRTDFSSYEVSDDGEWKDMGEYVNIGNALYHFSGGIEFKLKSSSFLIGAEYIYGLNNNSTQFANFDYPGIFDEQAHLALQNYPEDKMKYQFHGLGFYIGYSFGF